MLYLIVIVTYSIVTITFKYGGILVKPCADVASNLLAIDLRLDVRIACEYLEPKFQHAEHFTCDPLITQLIFIRLSYGFHC